MLQTHSIHPGALSNISCAFSTARLLTQDDSVFLVYASGDKIVFISQDLTPIEKIAAADLGLAGSLQVSAVSASEFRGVVAAAWGENLFLFHTSTFSYQRNILRLQWVQIQHDPIQFKSEVRALAWNKLGTRLLASHGNMLTLYTLSSQQASEEFQLEMIWETRLATSAHLVKFSPDGQLFATCGSQDRLVKVWYHLCDEAVGLNRYTFSYLKHSTPVVGFSWRDTHLYMPKNGVPNALLTHTADNTAYVWVQKHQSNLEDSQPISLYHCTTISPQLNLSFISSLPAETFTFAPVWVNNKVLLFTDHMLEMQKRDTYTYNAEYNTDISTPVQTPTIPTEDTGETYNFQLPDTPQDIDYATSLLKRVKEELTLLSSPLPPHVTSQLLNRWRQASDLILAINPLDGSILIWDLDNLDLDSNSYSVKKHSLSSRMPHNVPMEDAQCISTLIGLALYPSPIETQHDSLKRPRYPLSEHCYFSSFHSRSEMEDLPGIRNSAHGERSTKFLVDRLYFFSLHREGSLNVWHAMFSERSNYTCNVSGLVHMLTMGGHMFMEHSAKKHPSLPLMATMSQSEVGSHGYKSDLILWRTDRIGMLNSSGGLKQTAKLLGKQNRDFSHTVWLPTLLGMKGNDVGSSSIPTGTFLLTSVDNKLVVFLALCISPLDIWSSTKETNTSINQNFTENNTQFSTFSNSSCPSFLYKLSEVIDVGKIEGEVLSIQIFSEESLRNLTPDSVEDVTSYEEFECRLSSGISYIVILENVPNTQEQSYSVFDREEGVGDQLKATKTHVWRCEIRFDSLLDSGSNASILDRRVSKVTLFYDMITKLAYRIQVVVERLDSDVFPFTGERLMFVEQVSQLADTGHSQFSPFLFSTLASNGIINNWKCEVDSEGVAWLHYPSTSTSRICLNTMLKDLDIFKPHTFLIVLSVHVANACLMALCFKHAKSNSRFVALLSSQGTMSWICDEVIEITSSSTLCHTHSLQLEWIPSGDGSNLLAYVWGTDIGVYAKCYREQMRNNIELSEVSEVGISTLCGYIKSLAAKIGEVGDRWVRIASFEVPLHRVTDLDSISMYHAGGGALLLCVNAVLVLLSPWLHQPWERGMTPTRSDSHSLSCSLSLFDIAGCLKRYLPQYHPYVLLELVQGGMLDRLNMILLQVARHVVTHEDLRLGERRNRAGSLSVTGTTLDAEHGEMYDYSDLDAQLFCEEVKRELEGEEEDVREVKYVPPLPLPVLQQGFNTRNEEDEFFSEFTPLIQACLAKRLLECRLADLLPLEAMALQAIVDALGNMKLLEGTAMVGGGNDQDVSVVDECGLRYRLALKRFVYCRENSSEKDLAQVITPGDYVWAFHSVEQEKLLKDLPSVAREVPKWDELRYAGVCWWIRSVEMLRPWIERLAKCRFSERSDPLDAALFYLALNKKSILKHLFRTVGNRKMSEFFAHDFHEDRWKRAAKKNAFKLMSLQRFENAVAFFLLGHSIWDAVEVCIDKLKDFQLALLITRLLEGDRGKHYHRLLNCFVLCKGDYSRDIPELNLSPYLRSMAYWQMDDYSNAIDTLIDIDPRKTAGSICNFYFYLKSHPLICKYRKQNGAKLSQEEARLVFNTSSYYLDRGSPLLSMLVILKFDKEHFALTSRAISQKVAVGEVAQHLDTRIHTGTLSSELFSKQKLTDSSVSKETSVSFDWSQPSFSILTSVDFEPPKLSEKAADYDWGVNSSFNTSEQQSEVDLTPHVVHDSVEDPNKLANKKVSTDDNRVVLDLRPALLHAKFLTSLSFLCQNLSNVRAVNGEVLNSSKFNTYLRQLLSTELEQTAINLGVRREFTALRPLLLQLAEFLILTHDSLPSKQASITLIYSLVSTDFSHLHAATKPTSSIPLYTSALLPPAHFQNVLSYASDQVTDLFNFVKRFRFPFYPISPDTGVDMIWPQVAIISACILTSLSSINCGISHPSPIKSSPSTTHLYKLSSGSYNNKLASWPGADRGEYLSDVTHNRVTILLGECSACVLLALFANAYLQQNARLMSLLLHNTPDEKMWCEVFCGGEHGPPIGYPVISILDFYLRENSHPLVPATPVNTDVLARDISYDSEDSELTQPLCAFLWNLISLCAVKKVLDSVKHISTLIGIDNELPLKSPLLCQIKTQAQRWEKDLGDYLDSSCSLTEQIRSSSSNESSNSSSLRSMICRHMKMLERDPTSLPAQMRDLLEHLEQMEETRETLLNYLKSPTDAASVSEMYKPKVVFRDEDPVHAFCYSPTNPLVLAISTSKHIFEIDISRFDSGQWIEESDTSIDDPSPVGNRTHRLEDFLMVYQPTDKRESPLMGGGSHEQTGVTSSVLIKRAQFNVRRMEAHPELPYYLCGTQDGAVHLCQLHNEGIVQCLCKSHASITAIHFTHQGNKFGILDKEGSFSSCQGIYTSMSQPQKLIATCHSRASEDFCYLSSSSFIATCGHAGDSANVRLWDLLMPPKRMIVKQFYCHPEGCTVLAYSQRHQQLISGGKKGDVSIFDIRQQCLIQKIEAHTDGVRAIALNSSEDFYVTGCSSGSAKLWGLTVHSPIRTFSMLHPKSSIFRIEPGITQLSLTDDGYLLSSGGDGTIRRSAVHHLL